MAVISGFFDAVLHDGIPDRKYSADDFGAIFDGIISDGIFEKYPSPDAEPFKVTPPTDAALLHPAIQINPGRAWLNRTWTLNDSTFICELNDRDQNNPRIDGVYIQVNKDDRSNSIIVITGVPNANPVPSTPGDTSNVIHHLIAYIRLEPAGSTGSITDPVLESEITNMIGVDGGTPYVKSNVTDMNVTTENIIKNLEEQFDSYQELYGEQFTAWFESIKNSIGGLTPDQIIELSEMIADCYASDYLSGVYPYVDETCLRLSSDKKQKPPVLINFGFVSATMAPNPYANELTVYSGTIVES